MNHPSTTCRSRTVGDRSVTGVAAHRDRTGAYQEVVGWLGPERPCRRTLEAAEPIGLAGLVRCADRGKPKRLGMGGSLDREVPVQDLQRSTDSIQVMTIDAVDHFPIDIESPIKRSVHERATRVGDVQADGPPIIAILMSLQEPLSLEAVKFPGHSGRRQTKTGRDLDRSETIGFAAIDQRQDLVVAASRKARLSGSLLVDNRMSRE
jgi:hypothetical protein